MTTCVGVYIGSAGLACAGELWREKNTGEVAGEMAGKNGGRQRAGGIWREKLAAEIGGRKRAVEICLQLISIRIRLIHK